MPWRVDFLRSAAQQFESLDPAVQRHVAEQVDRLQDDPFFAGTKSLAGYPKLRRCRVGDHRIVYRVVGNAITIARIGTRGEVYRHLDRLASQLRKN